jgi:hypothetical protein
MIPPARFRQNLTGERKHLACSLPTGASGFRAFLHPALQHTPLFSQRDGLALPSNRLARVELESAWQQSLRQVARDTFGGIASLVTHTGAIPSFGYNEDIFY